jgi:hypothetical protein
MKNSNSDEWGFLRKKAVYDLTNTYGVLYEELPEDLIQEYIEELKGNGHAN